MSTVRWGVLSTAHIGTQKVIPAIQAGERCEVVAIGSRGLDDALEVATDLGIPRAYGSYQGVLDDDDVDAVYIPLPNHMHAEWSIAAARAGKHILCEKPIALTTGEAAAMAEAAADAGVIIREAFMYQFHPTWQRARELVEAGRIGDVVAIDSWFSYYNDDLDNIRNVLEYGGGALMDIGCYCIHSARFILGAEPTAVRAAIRRDPLSGVDIVTSAILEFGDTIAAFGCSTRAENAQNVDILGTRGRINIEIPFNIPTDRPARISLVAGGEPPAEPNTEVMEFPTSNQYTLQAEAFAAAIVDGAPLPDTGHEMVHNLGVIEKVFAAAEPGESL
ncbi:MAG: Gfo/Idh/MocA family oxidoreductase [Acidimicrobiia bacterium]|nr:Gfo/Idh/MocA family oxidoreductase [Acidimicrobiia bacterium]